MSRPEKIDRAMILRILDTCDGDKEKAAHSLGISLRTVYRAIEKSSPPSDPLSTSTDLKRANKRLGRIALREAGKPIPHKRRKRKQLTEIQKKGIAASAQKREDEKVIRVYLSVGHTCGSFSAGPGWVTGPKKLLMQFYHDEMKAVRHVVANTTQPRAGILHFGHGKPPKLLRVAPERLGTLMDQEHGMSIQEKFS